MTVRRYERHQVVGHAAPAGGLRMSSPILLHRMDEHQTNAWFLSESHRRRVGDLLAKKYRQDFGILNASFELIARVDARGAVTCLPPPFRAYHYSIIANKPTAPECPCAGFYDPEVQGAWRERGSDDHHPLCQFDTHVDHVFNVAAKKAESRQASGLSAQERPDEWLKIREEVRAK